MMLAFKAWKESQVRFLLSAAALLWFCGLFVLVRPGFRAAAERPYADFVAGTIYGGGIRVLYTIFVVVLGLGGLLPERAYGSVWFTLALPVSRLRLVVVRAGVGIVQVAALACMPALAVSTLSRFVHEAYPVADALRRSGQWAAVGDAAFGLAFLASVALEAPLAALGISLALILGYAITMSSPGWLSAVTAATAMVTVAVWITDRQDFS